MNKYNFLQSLFTILITLLLITELSRFNLHADVNIRILAINDFHGYLEPTKVTLADGTKKEAGGAVILKNYFLNALKGFEDRTFIVSAGDLIGASPPISSLLQDEPTIMFMNQLANKHCSYADKLNKRCNIIATCGNHEFDRGLHELLRLFEGGNHENGPFLENPYRGAKFPLICANLIDSNTSKPLQIKGIYPYVIKEVNNTKLAFIGVTLKDTKKIVNPSAVKGIDFKDEIETINEIVDELKSWGIKSIIAIIHQGGTQKNDKISNPIHDIVYNLDSEVDLVISGHTHTLINGKITNKYGKPIHIVQALNYGRAYAELILTIGKDNDIKEIHSEIILTEHDKIQLIPVKEVEDLLKKSKDKIKPLVEKIITTAKYTLKRDINESGESALGNLIADAQRKITNSQIAFTNIGGIRADLPEGNVTWGNLYSIQPFYNNLITMKLKGSEIYEVLIEQWKNPEKPKMLQVSGITYKWKVGEHIEILDLRLSDGTPILRDKLYTITVNSFLANGGDDFKTFLKGKEKTNTEITDLDALIKFLKELPKPVEYGIEGRIEKIN